MKDGAKLKYMVYGDPKFIPEPKKDEAGHEHKTRSGVCEFCGVHWKKCPILKDQIMPEDHVDE